MARAFPKDEKVSTEQEASRSSSFSSSSSPQATGAKPDEVALTLALANSTLRALSFLGPKRVVDSILDILELEHAVSLNDVARRPGAFVSGIESMFGAGSNVITKIMCAEIAKDIGVTRDGKTLQDLVKLAQEKLNSGQVLETSSTLD